MKSLPGDFAEIMFMESGGWCEIEEVFQQEAQFPEIGPDWLSAELIPDYQKAEMRGFLYYQVQEPL